MSPTATDPKRLAERRLWIGISGPRLADEDRRLLDELRPGGVVLFRRNVESLEQVRELVGDLRSRLGPDLVVSADHEGGLITRFFKELTVFPGNMALGAAGVREPALAEHLGEEQGFHSARELRDLGITVNLAPVVDVASEGGNPSGGIRSAGWFLPRNSCLPSRTWSSRLKWESG